MWGDVAIAFLLAFIVAFMATPYTIKIAKKVEFIAFLMTACSIQSLSCLLGLPIFY